jgi:hypothetical protein
MGILDRLTLSATDSTALTRIATALERIADSLEGKTPREPLPEAPVDPITVAVRDDLEISRFFTAEQELASVLGRTPTAEEVAQLVDGMEWDADDVSRALTARAARMAR